MEDDDEDDELTATDDDERDVLIPFPGKWDDHHRNSRKQHIRHHPHLHHLHLKTNEKHGQQQQQQSGHAGVEKTSQPVFPPPSFTTPKARRSRRAKLASLLVCDLPSGAPVKKHAADQHVQFSHRRKNSGDSSYNLQFSHRRKNSGDSSHNLQFSHRRKNSGDSSMNVVAAATPVRIPRKMSVSLSGLNHHARARQWWVDEIDDHDGFDDEEEEDDEEEMERMWWDQEQGWDEGVEVPRSPASSEEGDFMMFGFDEGQRQQGGATGQEVMEVLAVAAEKDYSSVETLSTSYASDASTLFGSVDDVGMGIMENGEERAERKVRLLEEVEKGMTEMECVVPAEELDETSDACVSMDVDSITLADVLPPPRKSNIGAIIRRVPSEVWGLLFQYVSFYAEDEG
ncbi:hypothetical protein HK101_008995, partial [Irineochytrium annulatum]